MHHPSTVYVMSMMSATHGVPHPTPVLEAELLPGLSMQAVKSVSRSYIRFDERL
jgi:MFS-type transporter involved in bile tolerance (Atg22 family)